MKHKSPTLSLLAIFFLALHNLSRVPLPWFDEGWMLSLARNWVMLGHYGHLLQGTPVPATILNAGLPATAPLALSFRVLGIGVWQGRLPSVFFLMGTCVLIYHLAQRLYGRKVATRTLIVLVLLPMHPDLHPIMLGRQALGEISSVFYLLTGYALLFATWNKRGWFLLMAPVFWVLALQSKPQLLPFFVVSLMVPFLWALWQRQRSVAWLLGGSLMVTGILHIIATTLFNSLLNSALFGNFSGSDPYAMTQDWDVLLTYVLVLDPGFRVQQLFNVSLLLIVAPLVLGIVYEGWHQYGRFAIKTQYNPQFIWFLILWSFATAWFAWFYFLSIGFLRHLFPAFVVGSIFAAKAFDDILAGFHWRTIIKTIATSLRPRTLSIAGVRVFLTLVLFVIASVYSLLILSAIFGVSEDAYGDVIAFLNNETSPTAVIETYDSELFLLLQRDYHYPPDSMQHDLNRAVFLGKDVVIDYDLSALGIECVVIGWTRIWPLYTSLLRQNELVQVYENSNYRVFCDPASPAAQQN